MIEVMMCFDSIAKVVLACFMCSKGAMRVVKKQHIHTIIELSSGPARTRFFQSLAQLLLAGKCALSYMAADFHTCLQAAKIA